jgi:low temperature requirement protein LtrA
VPEQAIVSPDDQGATFVELFFDLVFVFAVTRVTEYAAEHLDWGGLLGALALFWLIWWGWTQFTWALNAANTEHQGVRVVTLIATGLATVMAVSLDEAFAPHWHNAMPFAASYVAVRVVGIGVFLKAVFHDHAQHSAVKLFAVQSVLGLLAVLLGAFFSAPVRLGFWLAAMLLDIGAGYFAGNQQPTAVRPLHFAERHGLIVIIALGESMIAAARGLSLDTLSDAAVGGIAVLITCLLWWTYFGWIKGLFERKLVSVRDRGERGLLARDIYTFGHFPLVSGIVGLAIGIEASTHPDAFTLDQTAAALGVGISLVLVSTAVALWRAYRCVLWNRLIVCVLTVAGLTYAAHVNATMHVLLGLAALALAFIVMFEELVSRRHVFAPCPEPLEPVSEPGPLEAELNPAAERGSR